jgi:RNase adapter protein RapZ
MPSSGVTLNNRKRVIILTGLSGSGKSSAARALEDEGFFVVDNLPLALLPKFLDLAELGVRFTSEVAVVIDVRNRDFLAGFDAILEEVRASGYLLEIYFLDASDEALSRRYSETRRRHPLGLQGGVPAGIRQERQLLAGLRNQSTVIIDSSRLTPHQLRSKIVRMVRGEENIFPLVVHLQSFGFRYGIPAESDVVMDVRFLPNPHFISELQPLTGMDDSVSAYVLRQQETEQFLTRFNDLFAFLLPQYQREGKSYLTVSIGCTGGRHRSVSIVESLRVWFSAEGVSLEVVHRDIAKG